jgi:hypothetical protein
MLTLKKIAKIVITIIDIGKLSWKEGKKKVIPGINANNKKTTLLVK